MRLNKAISAEVQLIKDLKPEGNSEVRICYYVAEVQLNNDLKPEGNSVTKELFAEVQLNKDLKPEGNSK